MNNKPDITGLEDIRSVVDSFYHDIKQDDVLGPIFLSRIASDDWPSHLQTMYKFWDSVLFGSRSYIGNPFAKHISLQISKVHFERWLQLFFATIDNKFKGEKSDEMKLRASKMALMFQSKLEYIRNNPSINKLL